MSTETCRFCSQPKRPPGQPACCIWAYAALVEAQKPPDPPEPLRRPDGPRCEFCGNSKPASGKGFCCAMAGNEFVKGLYQVDEKQPASTKPQEIAASVQKIGGGQAVQKPEKQPATTATTPRMPVSGLVEAKIKSAVRAAGQIGWADLCRVVHADRHGRDAIEHAVEALVRSGLVEVRSVATARRPKRLLCWRGITVPR